MTTTYVHALPTVVGYVGTVTADAVGRSPLHESATVCPTAEEAEYVAWREWCDVPLLAVTDADLRVKEWMP